MPSLASAGGGFAIDEEIEVGAIGGPVPVGMGA